MDNIHCWFIVPATTFEGFGVSCGVDSRPRSKQGIQQHCHQVIKHHLWLQQSSGKSHIASNSLHVYPTLTAVHLLQICECLLKAISGLYVIQ